MAPPLTIVKTAITAMSVGLPAHVTVARSVVITVHDRVAPSAGGGAAQKPARDSRGVQLARIGTFDSPVGQTMIEIQFDKDAGVYRGHYWNTGTSFPVNELGPGQSIRFVVPNVGIFQGRLHGEIRRILAAAIDSMRSPETTTTGCSRYFPDLTSRRRAAG